ncbi:hypothetical protein HanIR_Chr09g0396271 [Helianthus annuus]|nr:hypothetical protein HanIR_Chr09g0396271 [Helianthus annuus]
MTITSPKCSLVHIFISNLQLMVTRSQINLREITCPLQLIEQVVDLGQWISILDSDFVKIATIDA